MELFLKNHNFFIFEDKIDGFLNYCTQLYSILRWNNFCYLIRKCRAAKNYFFLKIWDFGLQMATLLPEIFSWPSSSLFVPESKTSIRRSIGCQMAEIQANHVAKLPTDLPAERSWVPPSARGASVVSPLGLLCAITIGEIGSKLSCFLISLLCLIRSCTHRSSMKDVVYFEHCCAW